jgi:hypothetical protein
MTTHAIEVTEYSELDFEHITLQGSDYQYCSECGAHHNPTNQLWLCQYCGFLNVEES